MWLKVIIINKLVGRIIASEDSIDIDYIGRATRVEEICRG